MKNRKSNMKLKSEIITGATDGAAAGAVFSIVVVLLKDMQQK